MSKIKGLIVLCFIALCSQILCAQTRMLGIEEMFRIADAESKSIQSYKIGKSASEEALKTARRQRLPDVNVSISASYWGNGKLWDRDFENPIQVDMPHWGNDFALEVQQVLYSGGAINSGIRQAELGLQLAELDWQKNIQDVRFLLLGNYLNLYKQDNLERVLKNNLELTERIMENMIARREQGTVLKTDITRYELQREQLMLQLEKVRNCRKIINHQLITVLHLPADMEIVPDTTLLSREIEVYPETVWQEMALSNSLSLQQSALAIEVNKQKVKQERSELLPHISLIAEEHLNGPITIEVPVLNNNFNYWFIGIGLHYNLSSLFKNNRKLKQAHLNVRKTQEDLQLVQEQVENSVQEGYTNYQTAFTELRTQEKSVHLADENYDVISNRYQNGMALLTDLLDAGNVKLSADLGLVDARINVIYNYYRMKYITHTL